MQSAENGFPAHPLGDTVELSAISSTAYTRTALTLSAIPLPPRHPSPSDTHLHPLHPACTLVLTSVRALWISVTEPESETWHDG